MPYQFFNNKRPHKGLTYQQYLELFQQKIESHDIPELDEEQIKKSETIKLNYQRTTRINKTYVVDKNLSEKLRELNQPQLWMLITEDWCGDSAQIVPYIAKISECNS